MKKIIIALLAVLLLVTDCGSPTPPSTPSPEPTLTATTIPPTATPLPYDPTIYVELHSYQEDYGSLVALFESYQDDGICENPFREGYPRFEDGQWIFLMKNPMEGHFIIHDVLYDDTLALFSLSTSTTGQVLADFRHHYQVSTQLGALISIDIQGSFIDCCVNEDMALVQDFLYSPTTNDFVYIPSEEEKPIGFIAPLLTISGTSVYENEYLTSNQICHRRSTGEEDYITYALPGTQELFYSWGRESGCMLLKAVVMP